MIDIPEIPQIPDIPVMPEIPEWLITSVLIAIGVIIIAVPIRVLFEITRGGRDRAKKLQELVDRMKERFTEVHVEKSMLGAPRIAFTHDERPATLIPIDDKTLILQLEPKVPPKSHAVIRTRWTIQWPFSIMWGSFRMLRRIRVNDPAIDESLDLFASASFGGLIRDLAIQGLDAGEKPGGVAESLVVLNRLPGLSTFELRMSPSAGFCLTFRLRSEDLVQRPEELEAAVHHANHLYDQLVLY